MSSSNDMYNTSDPTSRQRLLDSLLAQQKQAQSAYGIQDSTPSTHTANASGPAYTPPAAGRDLSDPGDSHRLMNGIRTGSSIASDASTGAQIGSLVPGIGNLIGAGIGASIGGIQAIQAHRHNDTKDEREDFAKSLGVNDTTALWQKLAAALPADQANELRDRALNRIGKHDTTADAQWMQDVQSALDHAPAKPTTQAQDTKMANPTDPTKPAYNPQLDPSKGNPGAAFKASDTAGSWSGDPNDVAGWVNANKGKIAQGNSSQDPNYWIQRINENGGLVNGSRDANYWFDRMSHDDAWYNKSIGNDAYFNGGAAPNVDGSTSSADRIASMMGDKGTMNSLMAKLQGLVSNQGAASGDREALMNMLKQG